MKIIELDIPQFEAATKRAKAVEINARWCAYKADDAIGYSLTHRETGCSAGKEYKSIAACAKCARALERAYGVKRWKFTDPKAVKGMVKCQAIIRRHGGWI